MDTNIIAVNPGSSSREYAIYSGTKIISSGYYEQYKDEYSVTFTNTTSDHHKAISKKEFIDSLDHFLQQNQPSVPVHAAGIRVVSPGRKLLHHQVFDSDLYSHLQSIEERAPLHIQSSLYAYDQAKKALPNIPIFAISDSAFHHTLSHEARNYAIPRSDSHEHDIYRFGYHGTSVQSVMRLLKQKKHHEKIIVCHLGSGSSITAVKNNKSIDTSMGYSPLEGLIMSTRSGTIDIEAALVLKKQLKLNDKELISYLNKKSGLLGLSEHTGDIRVLLELTEKNDHNAAFALDAMVYRIRSYIGSYYAQLGGLDALVFTATVGERSAAIRRRVCEHMSHLGLEIDLAKNAHTDNEYTIISKDDSPVAIYVIPTNEPQEIAYQTAKLLKDN